MPKTIYIVATIIFLLGKQVYAAENTILRIAVSANFTTTAEEIAKDFEQKEGIKTDIISGSSGKLVTQITQGAPFDVLLAADRSHPEKLAELGFAHPSGLADYAIGTLVFVGQTIATEGGIGQQISLCRTLAIANPDTAPYGKAAMQALGYLNLLEGNKLKLVTGESVGQAMIFIESGAADCGFVSLSQVLGKEKFNHRIIPIPDAMHERLIQSAAIMVNSQQRDAAQRFVAYLLSEPARAQIKKAGYELP
jgi:molybdate transport system substrate-binding protein